MGCAAAGSNCCRAGSRGRRPPWQVVNASISAKPRPEGAPASPRCSNGTVLRWWSSSAATTRARPRRDRSQPRGDDAGAPGRRADCFWACGCRPATALYRGSRRCSATWPSAKASLLPFFLDGVADGPSCSSPTASTRTSQHRRGCSRACGRRCGLLELTRRWPPPDARRHPDAAPAASESPIVSTQAGASSERASWLAGPRARSATSGCPSFRYRVPGRGQDSANRCARADRLASLRGGPVPTPFPVSR